MLRTLVAAVLASGVMRVGAVPNVGDTAPDFQLPDQNGTMHSLKQLRGNWVALAFYPKSMTSGCTVQNRSLSQHLAAFEKLGVRVFGVSVNTVEDQKQFCDKEGLKHTLLADPDGTAATAYGVMTKAGVASRTTIVIAPDGRVAQVFEKVDPAKDAEQILAFVEKAAGLPDFQLQEASGKEWRLSEVKAEKGILILFVSPMCPVSRAYDDRMNAIAEEFSGKGFVIIGVNSNATDPDAQIKEMAGRMKFPIVIDRESRVADMFRASRTPEVILLSPERKLIYRGAIDDQTEPSKVTKNYLRDTLLAVAEGRPVPQAETQSFGCTIKRAAKK
ncbi:MAG: redoxin domain-containing protein [Fimbriimonadia bacterium]|jgi:peroxiredoxin Q/BCP